jgi:hypothetical protein
MFRDRVLKYSCDSLARVDPSSVMVVTDLVLAVAFI